jgi:putative nucleotidyltransferase with HDIG domain
VDGALIKSGKRSLPEEIELKLDFGSAKTPSDKIKILVKNVEKLLALPFAVVKIIHLCNDPSANAKDLERPIKSDPAFTAMIMRRANSAAYGGMGQAKTIQRAIVRIGLRSTRNIAASFSVFKLFSKEEKSFGFNRVWFWIHSLTTGICAQVLATLLKYKQPEDAFIAGLLHDIGKMILDDFMNTEYHKVLLKSNTEGIPMRMAEQSVFDVSHTNVGSRVARTWEFPSKISDSIGRHHQYKQLADSGSPLSMDAIVCIANQMAKAAQAGSGGDHLVEAEALALWTLLPEGLPWKRIMEKVFEELKSYTDILEIPPDQFQITVPEQEKGRAGIFIPNKINYGDLLQIALDRQGFQTLKFSSLDDPVIQGKDFNLVIGDLRSVQKDDEIEKMREGMSKISDKSIVLPPANEKGEPFNLDFFWLETQLNKL